MSEPDVVLGLNSASAFCTSCARLDRLFIFSDLQLLICKVRVIRAASLDCGSTGPGDAWRERKEWALRPEWALTLLHSLGIGVHVCVYPSWGSGASAKINEH